MLTRARTGISQSYHNQSGLICFQCLVKRQKSFAANKKRCYYDVLGVPQNAERKEIRTAYVSKTKELHPDKNINDPALHDQFVEVNEAYMVLGDETKRTEYDETKNQVSRISYTSGNSSVYSPYGSSRVGGSEETYFNPKFQAFYENDPYAQNMYRDFQFAKEKYRGGKSRRNKWIICLAFGFMLTGSGLHYVHIRFFTNRWKEHEDRVLRENMSRYNSVREKAKLNGARKQLQLLASNKELSDGNANLTTNSS